MKTNESKGTVIDKSMETFENWVDPDLKVDAAVPIFVKDAEDLFNEDLRPQNKPLLPFSVQTKNMGNALLGIIGLTFALPAGRIIVYISRIFSLLS